MEVLPEVIEVVEESKIVIREIEVKVSAEELTLIMKEMEENPSEGAKKLAVLIEKSNLKVVEESKKVVELVETKVDEIKDLLKVDVPTCFDKCLPFLSSKSQ